MRKFYGLFLIVMLVLAACGPGPDNRPLKKGWERNSTDTYSLDYPKSWKLTTSPGMGAEFILAKSKEVKSGEFTNNINLIVQDLNSSVQSLDDYVEISESQVKNMITDSKMLSSERIKLNGKECHSVIYTGSVGLNDLKFKQFYLIEDEKAYVLTLTGKIDAFDEFYEEANQIMQTFYLRD